MSAIEGDGVEVKDDLEIQHVSKKKSRETQLFILDCCLGLAKINSSLPIPFILIAASSAILKWVHHWQLQQVRRVGHQHNSAHTLVFHIKTVSALIALLVFDVIAMGSIFFFMIDYIWEPAKDQARYVGVAADVTTLAVSIWLNIAEYMTSCYQQWSDNEDYKSANRFRHMASIFHHGVRFVNYAAIFKLQCHFLGKFAIFNMVLLQAILSLYHLYTSIRAYTGQTKALSALVNRLPSIRGNRLNKEDICLICRDSLMGRSSSPPLDCKTENLTVKKLQCGHLYHQDCLYAWLQRSLQCPACRQALEQH